ncbi:MAG: DUF1566 domain-containing protein [Magnetococcus sp. YQC-5]
MKIYSVLLMIAGFIFFIGTTLNAAPPATMTYQGKLKTAQGVRVNGPTTLTFRIYDAATGGTKLWEETLSSVTIVDGTFKVILGKTTSLATLAFDKAYYLSMQVNTDSEMTPRMEMTSAPYAMNTVKQSAAGAADTLLKAYTMPENVTINLNGSGQATVTWNAVKGATSYNLYYATETGVNANNYASKANGKAVTGVTSPYTVTGLTKGTQYFFSMTSVTPVGESVASLEIKPKSCSSVLCDNGDGTITDTKTGLIGLKNANCFGKQTWDAALSKVAALKSGECGLTDGSTAGQWRLLTKDELQIYIDWKNSGVFVGAQSDYYWSSTTYTNTTTNAWLVYLYNGSVDYNGKTFMYYVWPVRGGQ